MTMTWPGGTSTDLLLFPNIPIYHHFPIYPIPPIEHYALYSMFAKKSQAVELPPIAKKRPSELDSAQLK